MTGGAVLCMRCDLSQIVGSRRIRSLVRGFKTSCKKHLFKSRPG